jgi:transposase InsO family protein
VEHHRKQAKALVRAYRAGERDAVERAESVLGERARERFLLSDAQFVVAREQGHRTWADLKRSHYSLPSDRLSRIRAELERARRDWGELGDAVLDGGAEYADGDPVEVRVRKRAHVYTVDDDAAAMARAGKPPGWLAVATDVVDAYALNVNRRGVVFVPAVEGGVDLAWLVTRIADCSAAVYRELLDLAD